MKTDWLLNNPVSHYLKRWYADPVFLKKSMRENQGAQLVLCMALGIVVGLVTIFLHNMVLILHRLAFALSPDESLSNASSIDIFYIILVPIIGGMLTGGFFMVMGRQRMREIVDPIEANAIHGGRMSVRDSLRLLAATLISNASGASLGMEAGYTQIGSGIMSRVGRYLNLRREDMRVMVAAGASAAIAAAFNAPIAGAFYGFELVLGSYASKALPQVAICALFSTLTMRLFSNAAPIFFMPLNVLVIPVWIYPAFIIIGILSGGIGIVTMKMVTYCEQAVNALRMPEWLRPALGGLVLAIFARSFPQVLGGGEGAIDSHLHNDWPFFMLMGLLVTKVMASAVCIGAGFRGGLFSSSLLIGCLFGQLFGMLAGVFLPQTDRQLETFMLVGMGAVSASIVGAPITMMLLVLEMTGNFPATTAVLIGVLFSSAITRYYFGYSFSTWRFHLRGLRISGGFDVGWVNDLIMATLMHKDTKTVIASMTLAELRKLLPAGSGKPVFVTDEAGNYMGVIDAATIFSTDMDSKLEVAVSELAKGQEFFLFPHQNIQRALKLFAVSQQEDLAVVESKDSKKIVGHVSEAHLLRLYANELESRNMAQSGAATPMEK